jgi:predicted ArsR family transcriptional regulator
MKKSEAIWAEEFKKAKSWKEALLSRLRFEGGMTVGDLAENVGICVTTAKRRVEKLVDEGLAVFDNKNGPYPSDWHFKPVP